MVGGGACCGMLRSWCVHLAGAVTPEQVRTPIRQSEFYFLPSFLIFLKGKVLSTLPLLYLIFRCPFPVRKHFVASHVALLSVPGTWHLTLRFSRSRPVPVAYVEYFSCADYCF